jgi:hypothetical protein
MRKLYMLFFLLSFYTITTAQWNNNTSVNLEIAGINTADQQVLPTSDGKTWIAYYTNNGGNYDMRAQLLDVNGNKLLGTDGVLVCNQVSGSATYVFNTCLDAGNNLFIAFQYQVSGTNTAVVTKVTTAGALPWGAAGVTLGAGLSPHVGVISSGEVVVAWNNNSPATLYMQKLNNSNGNTIWASPVSVLVGTTNTTRGQIIPNNSAFTLVFQKKGVGVSTTLYAQRYTSEGIAVWASPLQISALTTSGARYYSAFAENDTTYVGYYASQGSRFYSYVQRINPDGTIPWGTNGTAFADYGAVSSDPYQMTTNITAVPGSAYVWGVCSYSNTAQSQYGVFVQKFAKSGGAKLLGIYGKEVYAISASMDQQAGQLTLINDAPLFMSYDVNYKIYATRLDASGNFVWAGNRKELSSTTAGGSTPKGRFAFVQVASNQGVAVWYENRGTEYRSYAQNISASGVTGTLPVSLLAFNGKRNGEAIELTWSTATEFNNKGFYLEKSSNGREFSSIAFIATKATNGNSNSILQYDHTDTRPFNSVNYYRLKQVDNDGRNSYSNIIMIKQEKGNMAVGKLYPNPVQDMLNINVDVLSNDEAEIIIIDNKGAVVLRANKQLPAGENNISINIASLSKGIYHVQVVSKTTGEKSLQPMVKE